MIMISRQKARYQKMKQGWEFQILWTQRRGFLRWNAHAVAAMFEWEEHKKKYPQRLASFPRESSRRWA